MDPRPTDQPSNVDVVVNRSAPTIMKSREIMTPVRCAALGGIVTSIWALYQFQKTRKRKDDSHYLRICHNFRLALTLPRHSNFRVVAMLLLEDGTTILGANDEGSPTISGAICAERGALMQYRILYGASHTYTPKIDTVFVVSDHPTIHITPGCLCREYLYGHPAVDLDKTRVVLQSQNPQSEPETWSLPQLYPFASPTARMGRQHSMNTSEKYEETVQALMAQPFAPLELPPTLPWELVQKVYQSACAAARGFDTHDNVYPIRFAAACGGISVQPMTALQVPALEYGCTIDAVSQVLHQADSDVFVVQVDQWGLPHAPFAVARNAICEITKKQAVYVLVGMPLKIVRGSDLYPTLPTIF